MSTPFRINVLDPGQRKNRQSLSPKLIYLLIPLLVWFIMGSSLYFIFYLPNYREIERQEQARQVFEQELRTLNARQEKIEQERSLYQQASRECTYWTTKLISLSLSIPNNVWISTIDFLLNNKNTDQGRTLDIYGHTISTSHIESLDKIAVFIEEVNRASSFHKDFQPFNFISSQLGDETSRIMNFHLSSTAKNLQIGGQN